MERIFDAHDVDDFHQNRPNRHQVGLLEEEDMGTEETILEIWSKNYFVGGIPYKENFSNVSCLEQLLDYANRIGDEQVASLHPLRMKTGEMKRHWQTYSVVSWVTGPQ